MAAREPGRFRGKLFGGFNRKDVLTYIKTLYSGLDQAQMENESLRQRCIELENLVQSLEQTAIWNKQPVPTPVSNAAPGLHTAPVPDPLPDPKLYSREPDQAQMENESLRQRCMELENLVQNLEKAPTRNEQPVSAPVPHTAPTPDPSHDPNQQEQAQAENEALRQRCVELENLIRNLESATLRNGQPALDLISDSDSALHATTAPDPLRDPELLSALAAEPAPIKPATEPVSEPKPAPPEPEPAPPTPVPSPPAVPAEITEDEAFRQQCLELEHLIRDLEKAVNRSDQSVSAPVPDITPIITPDLNAVPASDPLDDPELRALLATEPHRETSAAAPEVTPAPAPVVRPTPIKPPAAGAPPKVKVQRK